MIVGSRPIEVRIQPIIAVVVDLPLVPATPMLVSAALNSSASNCARVIIGAPRRRAAWTSGMVSSIAAETTRVCSALVMPEPSWGWRSTPLARRKSNRAVLRPWSRARSEPATLAPRAWTISARGVMPLPPTPQKK